MDANWRAQLQPEARSRIVHKILETLTRYLPVSEPEELNELQRIAVRFEGEMCAAAIHQSDYLWKISMKMLTMERGAQQDFGNAVIPNQNNPGQEEIYQMIKSLKNQHFAELNKLFDKISVNIQHVDSIIPRQMPTEQYERMKIFKRMVDRILQFLLISKSTIEPAMGDKVRQYEKQIIRILNVQKSRPVQV